MKSRMLKFLEISNYNGCFNPSQIWDTRHLKKACCNWSVVVNTAAKRIAAVHSG